MPREEGLLANAHTKELLARWHAGDLEARRELLERDLDWIEARVFARLGKRMLRIGDPRDFLHEALKDFLQYGPRFEVSSRGQLRALFARIVESAIRDENDHWFRAQRRAMSREVPLPSDSVVLIPHHRLPTPPDERAIRNENGALVRLGIELLDPEDRRIILLRDWEGLAYAEIASQLGLTLETAKKRYQRALRRLAEKLERLQLGDLSGPT